MSTTTNEKEVAEVTPTEPRDINALLALDTYQGMSDAEIELLIEYRINRALTRQEILAKNVAYSARMEQVIADNRASAQRALDMVESLVNMVLPEYPMPEVGKPDLIRIGNTETVKPTSVEV